MPITSIVDKIYPFEVLILKNIGGLKEDSKAKANQIRTIDKNRIRKVIGSLSENLIVKIEEAIKIHLDIAG